MTPFRRIQSTWQFPADQRNSQESELKRPANACEHNLCRPNPYIAAEKNGCEDKNSQWRQRQAPAWYWHKFIQGRASYIEGER